MFNRAIRLLFGVIFICICSSGTTTSDDDAIDYIGFHDTATMPLARSDMTATIFQEGTFVDSDGPRIFLVGGCVEDQVCDTFENCFCPKITAACSYFVPETSEWHTCSDAPRERYRHVAANVNGKLYVAGGRDLNDTIIQEVDVYDPTNDSWSLAFHWPNATSDGGAFGYGDSLYLVGGYDQIYNSLATLTAIDVTSGVISTNLPSMKYGRGDIAVQQYDSNTFYVIGGWSDTDWCNASAIVELFNFTYGPYDTIPSGQAIGTWYDVPDMIYGRGDLAVGIMGDAIFAIAGETKNGACTESIPVPFVDRFTTNQGEWELEQSIPMDLFRFIGASYNGSDTPYSRAIYLFGGQQHYKEECSCYPISNVTLKYIPASTVHHHAKQLKSGDIAGIVIGGLVVLGLLIIGGASYYAYARRGYYTKQDIELSKRHYVLEGEEDEIELGGGEAKSKGPINELASINGNNGNDGEVTSDVVVKVEDEDEECVL